MRHPTAAGLLAAALFGGAVAGAGQAAGAPQDPSVSAFVETTCSYSQLEAALQSDAPDAAARLAARPQAQARLQLLLALPVDERWQAVQSFLDRNPDVQAKVDQNRDTPQGQQAIATLNRVSSTCHNY